MGLRLGVPLPLSLCGFTLRRVIGLTGNRELFEASLDADERRGPAPDGAFSGSAGGASCGDLVRISLLLGEERLERVSFDHEGCAATAAAAAATAELAEGAAVLEAARIGPDEIEAELGGLAPTHRHAAILAADA